VYSIETENLTKIYPGSSHCAISELNIRCNAGSIYSFLGENGAGKTTTVKILCTVLTPTSGNAYVNGFDIAGEPEKVRGTIGYLPQKSNVSIFFDWTIWENLKFFCAMNEIRGEEFKRKVSVLLKENDLYERRNDLFRNLSGGMQQKVGLIRSIIHDPEILFLDEPTAGLDVHSKLQTMSFIRDLRKEGRTIFLTTHDMQVAENLSDDIAFIKEGRILQEGSIKKIMEQYSDLEPLEIRCRREDAEEIFVILRDNIEGCLVNQYPIRVMTREREKIRSLVEEKFKDISVVKRKTSLEDIYLRVYSGDHFD
jgi:ABC-2 type transport system ATP-binding protein